MLAELEQPLPPNLSVVTSGDPFDLIVRSHVVVGFNTTGLLEAVAAGKVVIVPSFGEACEEERQDLIVDFGEAVEYARSPEAFKTMIADHAGRPRPIPAELPQGTKRVLRHWTGNDDGRAGSRVVEAVREEVSAGAAPKKSGAPAALAAVRA